jgi:anti-sigma B factor antagonist
MVAIRPEPTDAIGDLAIRLGRNGGQVVVSLCGELDAYTSPRLREVLLDVIDNQGNLDVAVALDELSFIDSSGLSVLIGAMKRVREGGGTLRLLDPTPDAYRVFEITRLTEVFEIIRSP